MGRRSPQINPSVAFLVGVGLMGAAASFLLLGQIESSTHPKTTGWYAAAIALLFMGLLAGLAGVIEWLRRWREDRSTPLTIEHDPDDPVSSDKAARG
jgi:formate hydrogenlyase subunit 3/multisubunit Na+/H+ antiporter MnhD subunit